MTSVVLKTVSARFWRMIRIPFQRDPLSGEGARLYGGRWNSRGVPALYLGADHTSAIEEYYRGLPKPGTLVAYDVFSDAIVDLTNGRGLPRDETIDAIWDCDWASEERAGHEPATWRLAAELTTAGADGALVPSTQNPGGTNLVLGRWHSKDEARHGAEVVLLDPSHDLR